MLPPGGWPRRKLHSDAEKPSIRRLPTLPRRTKFTSVRRLRRERLFMVHAGGCHCGNIHVLLRLSKPPEDNPVRTCTCSFCRSHNPRMISDPAGLFEVSADDWSLVELYRFGTRTADFLTCRRCGVFIAAVSDLETAPHA